jgi:alpha-amylase
MGDTSVPLPDLRTEDSDVSAQYDAWIGDLVSNYSIDGLRLDTVMEVNTGFWSSFHSAAGVYMVGEIDNGDADYVCGFQDYVPGVLNYATSVANLLKSLISEG